MLDPSRQYSPHLSGYGPSIIKNPNDLNQWLSGQDPLATIAIYEYGGTNSPPKATASILQSVFAHFSNIELQPGEDMPAQICVILEEPHALIPEWNQVTDQEDKNAVNQTARVVLQGRKYGMGIVVVTQRTANVTKTILNQCNTVLALRAFDQTGLDFLSNYVGSNYAQSISSLPFRHAVLVGKASVNSRPIIVELNNISREHWATGRTREEAAPTSPSD